MRGPWGNFWVRSFATVLFAVAANVLFGWLPLIHLAWGGGVMSRWGVLDFAGGSVVHVGSWVAVLPVWIVAEIKALRTAEPLPMGCYLIFLVVTVSGMSWLPVLAMGFVTLEGETMLSVVVSAVMGAGLAGIYYWFWQRRVRSSLPTN